MSSSLLNIDIHDGCRRKFPNLISIWLIRVRLERLGTAITHGSSLISTLFY